LSINKGGKSGASNSQLSSDSLQQACSALKMLQINEIPLDMRVRKKECAHENLQKATIAVKRAAPRKERVARYILIDFIITLSTMMEVNCEQHRT